MSRLPTTVACAVALAAFTSCNARPPRDGGARSARDGAITAQFSTEEQKILACLDLRDHIVDLYATEYVSKQSVTMSRAERTAFRDGWAEELAKRGTFDRFEQTCFTGLTPRKFQCGMQSTTTGGLAACMKLSAD
jgi:hypothetical protein